jgi:hypothetical protein
LQLGNCMFKNFHTFLKLVREQHTRKECHRG